MALFDNYQFGGYGGQGGGLLDVFRMMQSVPMQQPQGFPATNNEPAALPPNAQPTQGVMPQPDFGGGVQQPNIMGGIGDSIGAGLKSFIGNLHNGPIAALAGGIGGLATGERNDPYGQSIKTQNLTVRALISRGVPPQDAILAAQNPDMMKALLPRLWPTLKPHNVGQTVGAWNEADGTFKPQYSAPEYKDVPPGHTLYRMNGQGGGPQVGPQAVVTTPQKPREMSVEDIRKLQEEGSKFNNLTGFVKDFRDEYAGATYGLGDAKNLMGRTLPDWAVDPKAQQGAMYWQKYDRYKNVVRNELYGSALTPSEQRAFEQADVNNTMNPKVIRENLKTQQTIVETALKRRAAAMVSENFRPETIAKTYGMDVNDLQSFISGSGGQRGGQSDPLGIR